VSVYEPKGEYQLVCEHLEPHGLGARQLAFEQLKKKLQAEGLFDAARKRPLPALPRKIGIVTSLDGAAIRDIIKVLRRRYANAHLVICPARVQGDEAVPEIARALRQIARVPGVDVVIVGRGGGSIEDLWAFNEEVVARGIVASRIPVVSGVGHETDFSIADFVADLRAPTPTAAAVAASPDRATLADALAALRRRLARDGRRLVEGRSQHLDHLSRRLLTPAERLARESARVAELGRRLDAALQSAARERTTRLAHLRQRWSRAMPTIALHRREIERAGTRLAAALRNDLRLRGRHIGALATALSHLDPTRVLGRGYSIVRNTDGSIRHTSAGLRAGAALDITFSRGGATADVTGVRTEGD